MEYKDFYRRFFVVLAAIAQPIIILIVCGEINSISTSWNTMLQPMFIFVNALTSYYFFDMHKWRIPSVFLLLLTSFSVASFPLAHNILAVGFFLSCVYPLWSIMKFRIYAGIYLGAIPIGIIWGLWWSEVWAIYVLSAYHCHMLIYMFRLRKH